MSLALILAIAIITYLSRAASIVLLPSSSPRLRQVLNRVPAPLFAGLAALSLTGGEGHVAALPTLTAITGALLLSPSRSLLRVLTSGLIGWSIGQWVLPYVWGLVRQ